MLSYLVKVQGLQGGHSGVDIDKGLGHATKLLVRLLKGRRRALRAAPGQPRRRNGRQCHPA